jgi:(S)-2-hydroxyglutarate dehydrogenase
MSRPLPFAECDLAVVGAGIVGLAVARELGLRHPGARIQVLERERAVGMHQTGHNSGVIHQGVYYRPGSLKARLCRAGADALYRYCDEHGIDAQPLGKLVVAVDEGELERLDELERRSRANGVPEAERIAADRIPDIEPHVRGVAALWSPRTGTVDYGAVTRSLRQDVIVAGGRVSTGCRVVSVRPHAGGLRLHHAAGATKARFAVFCAGGWSDRLARMCGGGDDPRIVPFRGGYLTLRPEARHLVAGMVYPVPDPELPFLGVHLTRHVDGEVGIGPSALLAGARDAYRLRTIRPGDVAQTLTWPGTLRMARRYWRTGLSEARHTVWRRSYVAAAARLVPELTPADVLPGRSGVRAQAVGRDGSLIDDFVFERTEWALHVRNAPSPAATACLAIAAHVADEAGDTPFE